MRAFNLLQPHATLRICPKQKPAVYTPELEDAHARLRGVDAWDGELRKLSQEVQRLKQKLAERDAALAERRNTNRVCFPPGTYDSGWNV